MKQFKLRYLLLVLLIGVAARIYWQMLHNPFFLPASFTIGPLTFHWYGICLVTGLAIAVYLFNKLWQKFANSAQRKRLKLERLFIILLIAGVVGGRIYHLITDWSYYDANPISALYIWNGGLGIYGGIIAGILVLYLYCREKELPFLLLADLAALILPLGQFIGRFGNLFNRELFGLPTNLPWGLVLPLPGPTNVFHPTFLYEQIGDLALFLSLWFLVKWGRLIPGKGNTLLIYLLGYAVVRFCVDFFRLEPRIFFNMLTTAQFLSLIIILGVIAYGFFRKLRNNKSLHSEHS